VLKDGVLQQVGTPRELYADPKNVFVAGFIGSPAMNLFTADVTEGGVKFGTSVIPVDRATPARPPRSPSASAPRTSWWARARPTV
jgi:multiple sugar transport system ATP-binding protein